MGQNKSSVKQASYKRQKAEGKEQEKSRRRHGVTVKPALACEHTLL